MGVASAVLSRTDCVYFESFEPTYNAFGYSTTDVISELNGAGFQVVRMDSPISMVPIGPDYRSDACENLIAHRDPPTLLRTLRSG